MLKFRNINVEPTDPIRDWGVEGIITALEIGDVHDWKRVIITAREDNQVMDNLLQALECVQDGCLADAIVPVFKQILQNELGRKDLQRAI